MTALAIPYPPLLSSSIGPTRALALDDPHYYAVYFAYLHSGWMLYQCLKTPQVLQSTNYKLNAFTATNGVVLASKNSPMLVDDKTLFLHGAYREFDFKPSLLYVGDEARYDTIVTGFERALHELEAHLDDSALPQRLTEEARLLRTQHNPHDTTEE